MTPVASVCGCLALLLAPSALAQAEATFPDVADEQQSTVPAAPTVAPAASVSTSAPPVDRVRSVSDTAPDVEAISRFTDRPLTINVMMGGGTPVGLAGFTAEYSVFDRLAVGVGAGTSLSGGQAALLVRLRPIVIESEAVAQGIDLSLAFSTGQYTYPFYCGDGGCWKEQAYWAQGSLDYELSASNFHLATGFGVAVLAGATDVQEIVSDGSPGPVPHIYPTLHLTLGVGI
jgi:hypothetical protein